MSEETSKRIAAVVKDLTENYSQKERLCIAVDTLTYLASETSSVPGTLEKLRLVSAVLAAFHID